jgi:hypothetical protein
MVKKTFLPQKNAVRRAATKKKHGQGKRRSQKNVWQGNVWQRNEKKSFPDYSPAKHSSAKSFRLMIGITGYAFRLIAKGNNQGC